MRLRPGTCSAAALLLRRSSPFAESLPRSRKGSYDSTSSLPQAGSGPGSAPSGVSLGSPGGNGPKVQLGLVDLSPVLRKVQPGEGSPTGLPRPYRRMAPSGLSAIPGTPTGETSPDGADSGGAGGGTPPGDPPVSASDDQDEPPELSMSASPVPQGGGTERSSASGSSLV